MSFEMSRRSRVNRESSLRQFHASEENETFHVYKNIPATTAKILENETIPSRATCVGETCPQCPLNDECISSKPIKWKVFIFVKSAVNHTLRRKNIRNTWGTVKYMDGFQFSTIFIVGKASNDQQKALLNNELSRFSDILQVDQCDNYAHVVFKTLKGMQWASEHLNDSDYYASCDDDMMVNLGQLQESIEKYNGEQASKKWPEFPLMCTFERSAGWRLPVREQKHKNHISSQEYKWTEYPKFCLGGMYTTSVSVIKQLYEISKKVEPLRTDDVWITGVLRNIFGMPESMVVFPQPAVAQHIEIYGKVNDEKATAHFQYHWSNTFKQFSSKTICKC